MSTPLTIAGLRFESPAALRAAVGRQLRDGHASGVPSGPPAEWLARAVRQGELSLELARGLAAAMVIGRRPAELIEAARLAAELDMVDLAPILRDALDGLDLAVLLHRVAPGHDDSVEDELLAAWAVIEPGQDLDQVASLLRRLREAGLRTLEIAVLGRCGSPELVHEHLPPILQEPLSDQEAVSLSPLLLRDPSTAATITGYAADFAKGARQILWLAAVRAGLSGDQELESAWAS